MDSKIVIVHGNLREEFYEILLLSHTKLIQFGRRNQTFVKSHAFINNTAIIPEFREKI